MNLLYKVSLTLKTLHTMHLINCTGIFLTRDVEEEAEAVEAVNFCGSGSWKR